MRNRQPPLGAKRAEPQAGRSCRPQPTLSAACAPPRTCARSTVALAIGSRSRHSVPPQRMMASMRHRVCAANTRSHTGPAAYPFDFVLLRSCACSLALVLSGRVSRNAAAAAAWRPVCAVAAAAYRGAPISLCHVDRAQHSNDPYACSQSCSERRR